MEGFDSDIERMTETLQKRSRIPPPIAMSHSSKLYFEWLVVCLPSLG